MTILTGIQARYSGDAGYLAGSHISSRSLPLERIPSFRPWISWRQAQAVQTFSGLSSIATSYSKDKRPVCPKLITIVTSPYRRRPLYNSFLGTGV